MPSRPPPPDLTPPPWPRALLRTGIRLAVILVLALAVHWLIDALMVATDGMPEAFRGMVLVGALLIYSALIAVPFVPGVEIGISLLVLRGAEIAPAVYLATLIGLALAYLLGRMLPIGALRRMFLDLHLTGACRLIDRVAPLGPAERIAVLRQRLPARLGPIAVNLRYLTLAVLLNLPGNAVVGGGGGLMLLAGLTRLFAPAATFLTIALAVLPIPLAVWVYGQDVLQ